MDYGKLALKRIEELYATVYSLGEKQTIEERRVSMTTPNASGQTLFKRQLRFKTGISGVVRLNLQMNVSRTVNVALILDGEEVKKQSYSSSVSFSEVVCSGVPSGLHVAEVMVTGTSFSVSNFNLSVSGKIIDSDDDLFVEGFSSGSGYISLCLGRLEIYSFANAKATLLRTIYGINKARVFEAQGTHIACVTETGLACIFFNALSTTPTMVEICSGANSIAVPNTEDTIWQVFVGKNNGLSCYSYDTTTNILLPMGIDTSSYADLSAIIIKDKVYLVGVKSGYVGILEGLKTQNNSPSERFTLVGKREV